MTASALAVALLAVASTAGAQTAAADEPTSTAGVQTTPARAPVQLAVPVIQQTRERCGPAALEMVLRFYGAPDSALAEPERAYEPALGGALITDLAAASRRAGYPARIATMGADSLVALIAAGVPPIVLYQNGPAPVTVPHYGVVTGWDPARQRFTLNDGTAHPRVIGRADLEKRWRTAGSQTLIVERAP
jgi:ABC-type bacteriocin/lantibiotic exporter with double-glycine peptidase domain